MRALVFLAALLLCNGLAGFAHAHIRLTSPTARYVQDDSGLKTGPCGSGTKTGAITSLVPGQTLTVTWKESVSHAGHYRIALSAYESDFLEPTSLDIPATLPRWDLADGIQDKTGTATYSQDVQIPMQACPVCVLQLLQVMSTGTDGTNTGPWSGVYHACADVSISSATIDAGTKLDAGTLADARADAALRDGAAGDLPARDSAPSTGGAGGTGSGSTGTGGTTGSGASTGTNSGGRSGAVGGTSGGTGGGTGGDLSNGSTVETGGTGGNSNNGGAVGMGGSGGNPSNGGAVEMGGSGGNPSNGGAVGTSGTSGAGSGGHDGAGSSDAPGAGVRANAACGCRIGAPKAPRGWGSLSLLAVVLGLRALGERRRTHPSDKAGLEGPALHSFGFCGIQERHAE